MVRLTSVSVSISSYILALDMSQEQMYSLPVLKKKKKWNQGNKGNKKVLERFWKGSLGNQPYKFI